MNRLFRKLLSPRDKKLFIEKASIQRPVAGSPIHCENGQWYFWDETWADRCGPYPTKKTCYKALDDYCKFLESGPPEE